MTNTKFRKRALLSSVAMLLVALVALGSATFAWFTSSTTATASGINVKTTQASDLQISDSGMHWGSSVSYSTTQQIFEPCSSSTGTVWYSGEGTSRTDGSQKVEEGTMKPFGVISSANASKYYFTEMLNVRNNGTAPVTGVTYTFTIGETPATSGKNYLRVAVVPVTAADDTAAPSATPVAATFQSSVYDLDGVAYNAVDSTTTATTQITPENNSFTVNVGRLEGKTAAATDTRYYRLYVWFEGQDAECTDANAGNALPSITFTVSGTTAQS